MANKNTGTPANPFADWYENIQKMVGGSFPAVDMKSLTEAGQGNMKAMGDVAKIAANALQDIAKGDAQTVLTGSLETFRSKAEEAAKNFGDLSEIARKAQTDIWGVLTAQFEKNIGKK